MVIAAYRPHAGKSEDLLQLVKDHIPVLRSEGLVTDREPHVMRASNGTIVEVFEWKSPDAVEAAHDNPAVQQMWEKFAEVSDYENLANLEEANEPFAHFEPLDV